MKADVSVEGGVVVGLWRGLDSIVGASWVFGFGYDWDDEEGFAIKLVFTENLDSFIGKVIQNQ